MFTVLLPNFSFIFHPLSYSLNGTRRRKECQVFQIGDMLNLLDAGKTLPAAARPENFTLDIWLMNESPAPSFPVGTGLVPGSAFRCQPLAGSKRAAGRVEKAAAAPMASIQSPAGAKPLVATVAEDGPGKFAARLLFIDVLCTVQV